MGVYGEILLQYMNTAYVKPVMLGTSNNYGIAIHFTYEFE